MGVADDFRKLIRGNNSSNNYPIKQDSNTIKNIKSLMESEKGVEAYDATRLEKSSKKSLISELKELNLLEEKNFGFDVTESVVWFSEVDDEVLNPIKEKYDLF